MREKALRTCQPWRYVYKNHKRKEAMHIKSLEKWQHNHDFAVIHEKGERRTIQVLIMTAVTMVIEIVAGIAFGSMALLADGWHMGTHVAAFMIAVFAYRYARKHQNTSRFTFGTGKVTVLGGFASFRQRYSVTCSRPSNVHRINTAYTQPEGYLFQRSNWRCHAWSRRQSYLRLYSARSP